LSTQDFKRKLAAILHADVKGYSRLMGEDEQATVNTLTAYREAMGVLIRKHRGRVVHGSGDSLLADFSSVVDAVQCAVKIQNELKARNADLPEDRKVEFRIGINLGDVIEKGEDLHGDGVNIAARVEALAEDGGICITRPAYDQVKNKLPLGYEYLGEHSVKNITEPVRVYRILMKPEDSGKVIGEKKAPPKQIWKLALAAVVFVIIGAIGVTIWNNYFRPPSVEVASVERMAFPLPDKPSVAVLPFVNMSADPKQEYFSDGLTDQIISGLSKVPHLFVIARNSAFTYKGKQVKVQKVAEDLGVKYVLEGSVQKTAARMRITVQLIDALTGNHLWAQRYDRNLKDIFAVQDEITKKIITALQIKLTHGEQARAAAKGTNNLEAYLKCLQASEYIHRVNIESVALAKQLAQEAIALDPEYAWAYYVLGRAHQVEVWVGGSKSPKQSIARAIELEQKAIALDDTLAEAHGRLGFLYSMTGQHGKGVAQAERAVALNPNSAMAHVMLGKTLSFASRWEESIPQYKKAIRLNPIPPNIYFYSLGLSYCMTEQYEAAIKWCEKAVRTAPDSLWARIMMTAVYSMSGRDGQARVEAAEVLRINPKFSLDILAKPKYQKKTDSRRFVGALRKAGLPDKPPLPLPDKPSVAVLPFTNMSGDPKQEYFSDGITEEIITALSKVPKLLVIARHSTFTYKGKPVKVQQVSEGLGVRYVLEGSVRKAGDKIRITAQLIDAINGHHLWSERYDRYLKDIFAVQDEITKNIIAAMQVKLTEGEQARIAAKGTNNLEAYLKCMQANDYLNRGNIERNALAKQLAKEAIALDPEYAWAYYILARTHQLDMWYGTTKSPKESLAEAKQLLQKAIVLDDTFAEAYSELGFIFAIEKQHDKAFALGEKAVVLNPNSAESHLRLGKIFVFAARWEESIPEYKTAMRLNPIPPSLYFWSLGLSYGAIGRYEEAIKWCEKAVRQEPDSFFAHLMMSAVYSWSGRDEDARAEAAEVLRINPQFSLDKFEKRAGKPLVGALRKAGLK